MVMVERVILTVDDVFLGVGKKWG